MSKTHYSARYSMSDERMFARLITFKPPYQVEFLNDNPTDGKFRPVDNFVRISIPSPMRFYYLPDLKPREYNPKKIIQANLDDFVGIGPKAFRILQDLLPVEDAEIYEFHFEERVFRIIIPPALYPEIVNPTREQKVEAHKRLPPKNLDYFRLFAGGRYASVTPRFIERVEKHKLTGIKFI